jgi:hypothetical protein
MNARLCICGAVALGFGSAAMAADAPQAPKPTPEHEKLGYFIGKWTSEGTLKDGPMGPGGKMTGKDSCEWFEGKFAIVCKSTGTGPSGPSKGIGIISYSPEEKAYTYYGVDNSGMAMSTVPRGTREGDTWTYTDESKMGGKLVKSRYVMKEVSPTSYTFKYEVQGDDGKWATMMEGTETKEGKAMKTDAKPADKAPPEKKS